MREKTNKLKTQSRLGKGNVRVNTINKEKINKTRYKTINKEK